jgi:hypothetical protein
MRHTLFLFVILALIAFNGQAQTNPDGNKSFTFNDLNNIRIWSGWKLGNAIEVTGIVRFGSSLNKGEEEKRYVVVQKIDGVVLDSARKIEIRYDEAFFPGLENNNVQTILGYVSGEYSGMPNANNYKFMAWQDKDFHFELFFVVLR